MYLENRTLEIIGLAPKPHKKKNGYNYVLIKVGQRAMIYKQIITEDVKRYEVSLMRIKEAREFKGKQFPSEIWFPNNEAFGTWAWTCMTLERAKQRFDWLESAQECDFGEWLELNNNLID